MGFLRHFFGPEPLRMADVKCTICGDRGHVASDCKQAAEQHKKAEQQQQQLIVPSAADGFHMFGMSRSWPKTRVCLKREDLPKYPKDDFQSKKVHNRVPLQTIGTFERDPRESP